MTKIEESVNKWLILNKTSSKVQNDIFHVSTDLLAFIRQFY